MTKLYYLIGEPGVGKTTMMAALTEHLEARVGEAKQKWNKQNHKVPYIGLWKPGRQERFGPNAVEIGVRREKFGGTDALGMHMSPVIALWLARFTEGNFLGEGDRLGNRTFFKRILDAGIELSIIHLYAGGRVLYDRRAARGTKQDETWINGRRSMAFGVAEAFKERTINVLAEGNPLTIRSKILQQLPDLGEVLAI